MEFGLCCLFYKEPIKFKTYTYAGIKKLPKQEAWEKVMSIRCTYDLHHQRCHELKYPADGTEEEYFEWARETWKNYNYMRMHISTPKAGYTSIAKSRPHHNFIDINDLPRWLLDKDFLHLDIEAKAKEEAIKKLMEDINV